MELQRLQRLAVAAGHCWKLGLALLAELSWQWFQRLLLLQLCWLGWHELLHCFEERQNTVACQRLLQSHSQPVQGVDFPAEEASTGVSKEMQALRSCVVEDDC